MITKKVKSMLTPQQAQTELQSSFVVA